MGHARQMHEHCGVDCLLHEIRLLRGHLHSRILVLPIAEREYLGLDVVQGSHVGSRQIKVHSLNCRRVVKELGHVVGPQDVLRDETVLEVRSGFAIRVRHDVVGRLFGVIGLDCHVQLGKGGVSERFEKAGSVLGFRLGEVSGRYDNVDIGGPLGIFFDDLHPFKVMHFNFEVATQYLNIDDDLFSLRASDDVSVESVRGQNVS